MTFAEACGTICERETTKEVVLEIENDEYNNIKAFRSCGDRAKAFGFSPDKVLQNFRTYVFILSRLQKETDERKREKLEREKTVATYEMADYPEDMALAEKGVSTYGWWRA